MSLAVIREANAVLLRELPYTRIRDPEENQADWWADFVEACASSSENSTILDYIETNWEEVVGTL